MTELRPARILQGLRRGGRTVRRLALTAASVAVLAVVAVPSTALADSDQSATVIVDGADVSLPAVHPCTGEFVIVDFFDLHVVIRAATNPAGHFHEVRNISGKFGIGDLSGRFHETYIVNDFNPGAGDDSVTTNVQVFVGADGDGKRMIARVHLHIRVVGGEPVVEIDDLTAKCFNFP